MSDLTTSIRRFLSSHVELRTNPLFGFGRQQETYKELGLKYLCPEQIVLEHGIVPTRKLKSPWKGEPNECFVNASLLLDKLDEGYYTEGYFLSMIPMLHAWITLPDGSIYDPTLDDMARGADHYLGVPFTREFSERHLVASDMFPCVFIRDEMFNLEVLKGDFEVAKLEVPA